MGHIQDIQYKKEHMHEFNKDGIHKVTGTKYDEKGYDREGYDSIGYNKYGVNRFGFNMMGKNTEPFYDYDIEERKEILKERMRDNFNNQDIRFRKVEKKRIVKTNTYTTKEEIKKLNESISRLRDFYKKTKHNNMLPYSKNKKLKEIVAEANFIKSKIKILEDIL